MPQATTISVPQLPSASQFQALFQKVLILLETKFSQFDEELAPLALTDAKIYALSDEMLPGQPWSINGSKETRRIHLAI
jgi:hypothetical protein